MYLGISKYNLLEFKPELAIDEILGNVHDIIIITSSDFRIIKTNIEITNKLGYTENELKNEKIDVILTDFEELYQNKTCNYKTKLISKDESFLSVQLMKNDFRDDERNIIGVIFSAKDLTLEEEYKKSSQIDKLTQVFNRLKLEELLNITFKNSQEENTVFSLCILDIDHFKKVNDDYGHPAGDKVLVELSKKISENLRKTDIFGRWGGEEFIIIFPDTDINNSAEMCEKLRQIIETTIIDNIKITCSFGVTEFNFVKDKGIDSIISRADEALYISKNKGRNRVVLS